MLVTSALKLADLPAPPSSKEGWPWTEQSKLLPDLQLSEESWPRISIVTPSFNQGLYIEETIRSVLLQGYPNLEYIIIDGGSTDNTIEIIKKYQQFISYWISEPDKGQSDALNKGFRYAAGAWVGWQNSDDFYAPDTFFRVAKLAKQYSQADVLYGTLVRVNAHSCPIGQPEGSEFDLMQMLPFTNMFNASSFFGRKIFADSNFIDQSYSHAMDLEFFWRLAINGYQFQFDPEILAFFRIHEDTKSSRHYNIYARETSKVYSTVYQSSVLPQQVRHKALKSLQSLCIDCFGKSELAVFSEVLSVLIATAGLLGMTPAILIRYLLSLTGQAGVQKFKALKQLTTAKPVVETSL